MKKVYIGFVALGLVSVGNALASDPVISVPSFNSGSHGCSSSSSSNSSECSSSNEKFGASSMYSTSGSSRAVSTVFQNVVDKSATTRTQQQQLANIATGLHMSVADLRYEHADFRAVNNSGDIGGFTASGSYDFNENYSVGALVPYDYLSFNLFDAHRTGLIGYAKGKWKIHDGVEASVIGNGSYIYSDTDYYSDGRNSLGLHTYGGGFSSRLDYDKGGDLLASFAFSYQYNEDNSNQRDNYQHLVKLSPSVGYRMGDNAVVRLFGAWNNDITRYKTVGNQIKDSEFFDVGVEGSYAISNTWQLKGGYKKMLDLQAFDSDAFYLGSNLTF